MSESLPTGRQMSNESQIPNSKGVTFELRKWFEIDSLSAHHFVWALSFDIRRDKENSMTRREMKKLDTRIKTIKKAAEELKALSGGMQAVDRNVERILASVKMLEINVTDLLLWVFKQGLMGRANLPDAKHYLERSKDTLHLTWQEFNMSVSR